MRQAFAENKEKFRPPNSQLVNSITTDIKRICKIFMRTDRLKSHLRKKRLN